MGLVHNSFYRELAIVAKEAVLNLEAKNKLLIEALKKIESGTSCCEEKERYTCSYVAREALKKVEKL